MITTLTTNDCMNHWFTFDMNLFGLVDLGSFGGLEENGLDFCILGDRAYLLLYIGLSLAAMFTVSVVCSKCLDNYVDPIGMRLTCFGIWDPTLKCHKDEVLAMIKNRLNEEDKNELFFRSITDKLDSLTFMMVEKKRVDITSVKDDNGAGPLHAMARIGDLGEFLRLWNAIKKRLTLIEQSPIDIANAEVSSLEYQDNDGATILMHAARNSARSGKMISLVLRLYAEVVEAKVRLFNRAISKENLEKEVSLKVLQLLKTSEADDGDSILHEMIRNQLEVEDVSELLNRMETLTSKEEVLAFIERAGFEDQTALHILADNQHVNDNDYEGRMAGFLLRRYCNNSFGKRETFDQRLTEFLEAKDYFRRTALEEAEKNGKLELLRVLRRYLNQEIGYCSCCNT